VTDAERSAFSTIPEAIADIRTGKMLVVVDDEDRENEGDLIMAAEMITPETVNFMAMNGRGLICLSAEQERLQRLDLDLMVGSNTALHGTAFTVSIDVIKGATTGISAQDRATTIKRFVEPDAKATDFGRPGHVFPLEAANGGVLRRAGHTEASVDLAKLAGLEPAGVLCEILNDDGSMARVPQLLEIAKRFGLRIITVKDLISYRRMKEKLIQRTETVKMPTGYGDFDLVLYESLLDHDFHPVLVRGDVDSGEPVLVRMHSQCLTGDVFASRRCDCGSQLHAAMCAVEREGRGAVVYMRQEGRGIGLLAKMSAYRLQEEGLDTVEANHRLGFPADLRDYGIGAQILLDLGITRVKLITNNPAKRVGLEGYGIEVVEMVPIQISANEHNERYLRTKKDRMGHILDEETLVPGNGHKSHTHCGGCSGCGE
jgi:3,4-dihydroxy 2-butanone 4-phosphate synthase / GTP cyclohydrolase II